MNKMIFLAVIALGFSTQAAKLIHTQAWKDHQTGEVKAWMSSGLGETGFEAPTAVCFIGKAEDVCKAVKADADSSAARYSEGDHGKYDLNTCTVVKGEYERETVVKINYTRINDYEDDVKLALEITNCN